MQVRMMIRLWKVWLWNLLVVLTLTHVAFQTELPSQQVAAQQLPASPSTADPANGTDSDVETDLDTETDTVVSESTVGMAKRVDALVLPGGELMVKPMEDRHHPFVLRIENVYKHGTDHRYDLEYYALEQGKYNLAEYLVLADGSPSDGLPATWVNVIATLPAGQVLPSEPETIRVPFLGGYSIVLVLGGVLWVVGLGALIFVGRRKKFQATMEHVKTTSMADRLRPLVVAAKSGTLDSSGRAELERTLIAYWCRRLGVRDTSPGETMNLLRNHDQAGALLRSLEDWLHRPDPPQNVDVETLLEPYANAQDETLELGGAGEPQHGDGVGTGAAVGSMAARASGERR
jgi:hypothetical protein